jgi:hypothetical protein
LNADPDPDPAPQINADPCGYGSGSETETLIKRKTYPGPGLQEPGEWSGIFTNCLVSMYMMVGDWRTLEKKYRVKKHVAKRLPLATQSGVKIKTIN